MIITILAAHLLTSSLYEYMLGYKRTTNPYKFTAIGMLIIVVVFYPAMKLLDRLIKKATLDIFRKGKSRFGLIAGAFIVFGLTLSVLYLLYIHHWYHLNVWRVLGRGLGLTGGG